MSKNFLRFLKFVLVITFIITLFTMIIISEDSDHLFMCHDCNCLKCAIINFAQATVFKIIDISFVLSSCILFYFFIYRIFDFKQFIYLNSLVFNKVQLNE